MESPDETLKRILEETQTRLAREEGLQEGQQKLLLRLLAKRFGTLPEWVTARVMAAGVEDLERWSDRILDAGSLDEVFAEP